MTVVVAVDVAVVVVVVVEEVEEFDTLVQFVPLQIVPLLLGFRFEAVRDLARRWVLARAEPWPQSY